VSATFDSFAEAFTYWTETANPKRYDELLAGMIAGRVERALDIGCGPGFLTFWLADRATHVTGLDVSPAMIGIATKRRRSTGLRNVDFAIGDAENPPFGVGTFDLVVSDATLHDTVMERSLAAIRELVKPGGRVVLRDVITRNPARARSRFWQLAGTIRSVPGYLRRLGPATTARVLRFEASPAWLRHRAAGGELTPDEFERTYARHFPGCRFSRQGWFMIAAWDAPPAAPADTAR
jgi:SAM-dependent methyltransferase